MAKSRANQVKSVVESDEESDEEPAFVVEQEIKEEPEWKIRRAANLALARKKASDLRQQIRDATPEQPKVGRQKLNNKLSKLKDDKKILEMAENDVKPVDKTDDPVDTKEENVDAKVKEVVEEEPVKPVKKERKKKVVETESEEEEPVKPVDAEAKKEEEPPVKPTFQRGADGVWYF
jgi:hypothetical protein